MAALLAAPAAWSATISDGIATITVSNANGSLTEYSLAGQDHLFQADYYFRTGSMTAEDMMTGVNSTYINSVSSSGLDITVSGSTSEFDFTLVYSLDGQGRMIPSLDITNTTASTLDLSLFNYQDWDVDGPQGDTAVWNGADMLISDNGIVIQVTPFQTPDAIEARSFQGLRQELRDNAVTNLTDGAGLPFGPGDATFAFQFDLSLAAGETTTVIYTVPEPSTGLLGLVGLAMLAWGSRRRRQQLV
jgi:hypothetical protein